VQQPVHEQVVPEVELPEKCPGPENVRPSVRLSVCMYGAVCIILYVHAFVSLSACLSVCPSACLSVCLSAGPSVRTYSN